MAGTYPLEIDYTTSGVRTFYIYVNNGPPTILNVNGSTFDSPVPVVIPVQLNAGANKIVITNPNPTGYAPGLDSITVGPGISPTIKHAETWSGPNRRCLPFHGSQSIESKAEGGKNITFRSAPRQSQRDRHSGSGSV